MILTKILHLELENSTPWRLCRCPTARGSHRARKLTAESELQPNLLRKTEYFEGRKRKGERAQRQEMYRNVSVKETWVLYS